MIKVNRDDGDNVLVDDLDLIPVKNRFVEFMDPINFIDTMLMNKLIITARKPEKKTDKTTDKDHSTNDVASVKCSTFNNEFKHSNI